MKLAFRKIHRESIFDVDFDSLAEDNGTIEFKGNNMSGGIAVIYAPNGTGKTSFAEVLKSPESTDSIDFQAIDDFGTVISPSSKAFHVVADQVSSHIILGDESQYLVGADIRSLFVNIGQGAIPWTYQQQIAIIRSSPSSMF